MQDNSQNMNTVEPQVNATVLAALGITPEAVLVIAVEKVVAEVMAAHFPYDGADEHTARHSTFEAQLSRRVHARLDAAINAKVAEVIGPWARGHVATMILNQTNAFGEQNGPQITLTEYIAKRADEFIHEKVDHQGNSQQEVKRNPNYSEYSRNDSSSFKTPRIVHVINAQVGDLIRDDVKKGVGEVIGKFGKEFTASIRAALAGVFERVSIEVKVPK